MGKRGRAVAGAAIAELSFAIVVPALHDAGIGQRASVERSGGNDRRAARQTSYQRGTAAVRMDSVERG